MLLRAVTPSVLVVALVCSAPSYAQQTGPSVTEKVNAITDALVKLCLATGSQSTLSIQGNIDLEAKLKEILSGNIGAAAKGATKFDKQVWEGIIGGISKDMSEVQARQSSEARKCMTDLGSALISEALKNQ